MSCLEDTAGQGNPGSIQNPLTDQLSLGSDPSGQLIFAGLYFPGGKEQGKENRMGSFSLKAGPVQGR